MNSSFQELVYAESSHLEKKLSDHFPVAVTLSSPGVMHFPEEKAPTDVKNPADTEADLLRRIRAIEIERESLKEGIKKRPGCRTPFIAVFSNRLIRYNFTPSMAPGADCRLARWL